MNLTLFTASVDQIASMFSKFFDRSQSVRAIPQQETATFEVPEYDGSSDWDDSARPVKDKPNSIYMRSHLNNSSNNNSNVRFSRSGGTQSDDELYDNYYDVSTNPREGLPRKLGYQRQTQTNGQYNERIRGNQSFPAVAHQEQIQQRQFAFEVDRDFGVNNSSILKSKVHGSSHGGYSMATRIDALAPGIQTSPVIGFVLSKDDMKVFEAKERSDNGPRSVLSFVVRDSPFSYINVSLWGKPDALHDITGSFSIGDIVQIGGCNVKEKKPQDDKYRPWTPSQYQIILNETHASINNYDGSMLEEYTRLAHMPLQTPGPVYKLSEIAGNIKNLGNDLVSFTAAVRSVGPAKYITSKSSGRKVHLREIKLFDQQVQLVHLILWSNELIQFSEHWQTNETVLSVIDVKVSYDQFKKGVVASASSKTIFILNPDTREGAALYQFAQTVTWPADDIEKPLALQNVDLSTVRAEYNVFEFVRLSDDLQPGCSEIGIIYGFLSSFNIDASLDYVLSARCCDCGKMLQSIVSGRCNNYDCMSSNVLDLSGNDIFYSLKVEISDYTGTIVNCKLTTEAASTMLEIKADEFAQLDDTEKTLRKWKFLFERCRFIVKAYRLGDSAVNFVVLEATKLTCHEHIKHIR